MLSASEALVLPVELAPTRAGDLTQWTGSPAPNWQAVSTADDNRVVFLLQGPANVGKIDLYGCEISAAAPAQIRDVIVSVKARWGGIEPLDDPIMAVLVKVGGVQMQGPDIVLTDQFIIHSHRFDLPVADLDASGVQLGIINVNGIGRQAVDYIHASATLLSYKGARFRNLTRNRRRP